MNNLQIFRRSVKRFLINQEIQNQQQFKNLVNSLCDQKLLHPDQVKQLICGLTDQKGNPKVQFPLTINKFQHLIMTQFGDVNCESLLKNLQSFQKIIKQTKGTLNVWKDKGLTLQQKLQLQSIFAKGNKQINELCQNLKKKKHELENISQQQIQMVNSLNQWVIMQKIQQNYKNFQDYHAENKGIIQKLLIKIKVKEVNFKNKKKQFKNDEVVKIFQGYNSKNDEPVQILLILRNSINFQVINSELITLQALKDLFLSKHFPRYLGNNLNSDPLYFMYFRQAIESVNLKYLQRKQATKQLIGIQTPLFYYWARQIYSCFYDIFLMSSYAPTLPILLSDFQIAQLGLRVVLKNIKFEQSRKSEENNIASRIQPLQTQLLKNFGLLLLQLLNIQPNFQCIQKKMQKHQDRTLFKTLISIERNHQNFIKGNAPNYLSMFNIQTHPLLQAGLYIEGETILQNFMLISGGK